MRRGPLMIVILTVELAVALVLVFNYQYILDRLSISQNPNNPATTAANGSQAGTPVVDTQTINPAAGSDAQITSTTDEETVVAGDVTGVAVSGENRSTGAQGTIQTQGTLIPELSPAILSVFDPLPAEAAPASYQMTNDLIALGRALFYDPRLSKDQQQSCHTCHVLTNYGTDQLAVSIGHDGNKVKRNAPTVYNAALHIAQFWDGRSSTVEEQAKAPILNAGEMGMLDPSEVEAILRSLRGYRPLFEAAFPDEENPITFDNVAIAIGAFERRLMTPSRFDQFLNGDYGALTEQEQRGLATFADLGCPTCHVGVTVGGLLYKKLGEVEPYPINDLGRFLVTGDESDRYVFKVPSLRNAAMTAPYLHDGSITTLEEMVVLMARHQLGKEVTPNQVTDIVAFIHSLTGEIPAAYIAPPPLP